MSREVTIYLANDLYDRANRLAQLTGQTIEDVLVTTLTLSLPLMNLSIEASQSVVSLSDEELLSLAKLQVEADQNHQLSRLLDRHQAKRKLSEKERSEMLTLMRIYQQRLLRKAEALSEVLRRELQEQSP